MSKKIICIIMTLALITGMMSIAIAGSTSASGTVGIYPTSASLTCLSTSATAKTTIGGSETSRYTTVNISATQVWVHDNTASVLTKKGSSSGASNCTKTLKPDENYSFVTANCTHSAGYLTYKWSKFLVVGAS